MGISRKSLLGVSVLALTVAAATYFFTPDALGTGREQTMDYLTPSVKVDALYPSMLGPQNTDTSILLSRPEKAELLWVTGYRADMEGPERGQPRSAEFMCHNTLSIHDTVESHSKVMGSGYYLTRRLFTLSQGQSSLDFPPGYGIPVSSAERFMLQSQVLNLRPERIGQEVRHHVRTQFVSDKEAGRPMKALSLIDFGIALEVVDPQAQAMPNNPLSCAGDAGGQSTFHRGPKEMTAHWVVKPGQERRATQLARPFKFNTKIHYISVHLHSYAQSLELWDKTENKSVYKAICKPTSDNQGLAEVGYFSSEEGLQVYSDHEYELISNYNNTSSKDTTAMAFMFCYVEDPYFRKPEPQAFADRSDEFCSKNPGAAPPDVQVAPPPTPKR